MKKASTIKGSDLFYYDGELHKNPPSCSQWSSWLFCPRQKNGVFAKLYARGVDMQEVCPDSLSEELSDLQSRFDAFHASFNQTGTNWREIGLERLIPDSFLKEYMALKAELASHVVETYQRPEQYEFYLNAHELCHSISQKKLNKEYKNLIGLKSDPYYSKFLSEVKGKDYIYYDVFGTKTGRLSCTKRSFPVLTIDKKYRDVLTPQNDLFVEFDYNAAELRTVFKLLGHEQPSEDLHNWNIENVFDEPDMSRDLAKKRVFSWLYGEQCTTPKLMEIYDTDQLLDEYWDGKKVKNPFGREIKSDRKHALSYLVQSTFADYFLRKAHEVKKIIENNSNKSYISFLVHDSLCLDLEKMEKSVIMKVKHEMEKEGIPASLRAGQSFGSLSELNL